jgi:membrane protein DedA with SNARE-associated domain
MEDLLVQFGYIAVFVGTFLEGETILALAGFAASNGYLLLPKVMAVAVVGAFLGDQACFFVGGR